MRKVKDLIDEKKQARADRKATRQARRQQDRQQVKVALDQVTEALEGFNFSEISPNRLEVLLGDRSVFVTVDPTHVSFGFSPIARGRMPLSEFEEGFASFLVESGLV